MCDSRCLGDTPGTRGLCFLYSRTEQQMSCRSDAGLTRQGPNSPEKRRQNTRAAASDHDLGAAPQTGIQYRCVDLTAVWRRSTGHCLYRGSNGHRLDPSALTGQGRIARPPLELMPATRASPTSDWFASQPGFTILYIAQQQKDRLQRGLLPE